MGKLILSDTQFDTESAVRQLRPMCSSGQLLSPKSQTNSLPWYNHRSVSETNFLPYITYMRVYWSVGFTATNTCQGVVSGSTGSWPVRYKMTKATCPPKKWVEKESVGFLKNTEQGHDEDISARLDRTGGT